jgi:Secretion system C-terminal sorting domain
MKKILLLFVCILSLKSNVSATVDYFLKGVAVNTINYTSSANHGTVAPNTLSLKGGGGSTYQNGGDDVCGAFMDYTVSGGGPSGSVTFVYAGAGSGFGDKIWANPTTNVNISGLADGTYTLTCNYRVIGKFGGVTCFGSGNDFTTGALGTPIVITFTIATPLPINLSLLDAKKYNDKQNLVSWTTESEKNGSLFEVEKSINGKSWAKIGEVNAAGTTARRENYSFVDKNPAAKNYYRLKMLDRDGSFDYSKIVSVNNGNSVIVSLYPNPVREALNLNIEGEQINEVTTQVINTCGQVVLVSRNTVGRSNGLISLDTNELQAGIYFIRVTDENANVIAKEKFLKQ